jgi:hypothetical protein
MRRMLPRPLGADILSVASSYTAGNGFLQACARTRPKGYRTLP